MATLSEEAKAYQPKQTKNISELPVISIDFQMYDAEGTSEDGTAFKYKYVEVNGEKYKVPNIVIGQIKDLLEENANLKHFKVKRTGEGLKTRYMVIPLN